MLDQRKMPAKGIGLSPLQRLMASKMRGLPPTATTLLKPKVEENVRDKIKLRKQKAKHYDNVHTAKKYQNWTLDKMQGSHQPPNINYGECVDKLPDRSYLVSVGNETLRRNWQFITSPVLTSETPGSCLQ